MPSLNLIPGGGAKVAGVPTFEVGEVPVGITGPYIVFDPATDSLTYQDRPLGGGGGGGSIVPHGGDDQLTRIVATSSINGAPATLSSPFNGMGNTVNVTRDNGKVNFVTQGAYAFAIRDARMDLIPQSMLGFKPTLQVYNETKNATVLTKAFPPVIQADIDQNKVSWPTQEDVPTYPSNFRIMPLTETTRFFDATDRLALYYDTSPAQAPLSLTLHITLVATY